MPGSKGYRSDRLRRRRRSRVERSQAWLLYISAGVVAFLAVLAAWYLADRFFGETPPPEKAGYLAAVQLTVPDEDAPVAGLLVVQDAAGGDPGVYLLPPDLLLEGPNGEYVFAADAMALGDLAVDLGRVVRAPIDAVFTMPVSDLGRWAGSDVLQIDLDPPAGVSADGGAPLVGDDGTVATADLPRVFAFLGDDREETVRLQTAVVEAALETAALRPRDERPASAGASPSPAGDPAFSEVVAGITSGRATVEPFPAVVRVAEGQSAFVPLAEEIQARITRRAPSYRAAVTVQVFNGSGRLGVGRAVVERLASLDVNLPEPLNADSFSYAQTEILAGPETLPVARDIRAILGRGVVLDGPGLPKGTVQVIVGDDFDAQQSSTKDQP